MKNRILSLIAFGATIVASPASAVTIINFDNLGSGVQVTNQYAGVTFSSQAGSQILTTAQNFGTSLPNFICSAATQVNCVDDVYVDFSSGVSGLSFMAVGDNNFGHNGDVRVFAGASLLGTVNIIGDAKQSTPFLVDLGAFSGITRIEIANITDAAGLGYDDFTFTAQPLPPPPTDLELAKLSEAVYTNGAQDLSGFVNIQSDLGLGFGAAAFKKGNEIVVAFRGTDIGSGSGPGLLGRIPAADIFKDLLADGSFITGSPTTALESYASQAAQFLASVSAANPGAQITITGHSLGGAIAQLTGNVSGYRTVAFDAPGPQSLVADLADELSAAQGLSGGQQGAISTFRLFGDPISAVGQQIGSLTTVGSQASQGGLSLTFSAGLKSHVLSNLVSALSDTTEVRAAGLVGPVVNLLNFVAPVSQTIVNGSAVYRFTQQILPTIDFGIDPAGGGGYTFLSDPGSPSLQSIVLPEMNGLSYFSLSSYSGSWGNQILVNPLGRYDFGTGVSGFTLLGYDANGSRMDFAGSILFDLSFREAGTLNASLVVLPPASSVPEPMTWVLMIFGFGFVGSMMRRRPLIAVAYTKYN